MIPRIHKQGSNTIGLLHYLYGRGIHEEHIDPHLVASFDGMSPDPGRDSSVTKRDLQRLLDQPLSLLDADQRPGKHVWHCSVRAAPDDPILTDEQWADIARRMVTTTGIDPGDGAGCRWAAVRHADDHIHIIATLVREDGRRPNHHRSGKRAQQEARLIEADYDLHRITPGDGTAAKRPTSAERHKSRRRGRDRTVREELRSTVRASLAGAATEHEFLDRLKAAGLLVRTRVLPSGDLRGYTVALPGDRNKDGEPVFYSGSTLAPDLSLPRIQARFATTGDTTAPEAPSHQGPQQRSAPSAARRTATHAAWETLIVLHQNGDGAAAAHIAASGEILDALAKTSALHTRRQLQEAASAFERASRSHAREDFRHSQQLRRAARELVRSGPAFGRSEDGATTAMAIDMLFFLISAAAHWHARKGHGQQAAAARQAAGHLRAAYQTAASQPLDVLSQRSRHLRRPLLQRQTAALREALPELAEQILTEPGWSALAVTLTDAENAGHSPTALLAEAAGNRELESADSVSDVLVWRLRRAADLPADTTDVWTHEQRGKRWMRPAQGPAQGRTAPRARRL